MIKVSKITVLPLSIWNTRPQKKLIYLKYFTNDLKKKAEIINKLFYEYTVNLYSVIYKPEDNLQIQYNWC